MAENDETQQQQTARALQKTVYRVDMDKLKARVNDTELMLKDAKDQVDEIRELLGEFEDASTWQTRFGALLAAVRDLADENDELKSVANDLCRDIPDEALPFGMLTPR